MVDFRNGPHPRSYLAGRERTRLFLLVTAMIGILWVALEARNPEHYRWIWNWGRGKEAADAEVDTRFVPPVPTEDDTFVFVPAGADRDPRSQTVAGPLTEEDLAAIRDDEPFRAEERGAWFKLFDRLRNMESASLREQSAGPVTFIQLYRQPKEYRAALVTLGGTLRRSEKITAPGNDVGIESYYRTWLFPRDNPSNPIVVYTLSVPDGFPQGMEIEERVELDGFFFKRWPYAAQDMVRSAPVVLAKSLRRVIPEPEEPAPAISPVVIVAMAAAAAAVFVAMVWWRTRPTRRDEPLADLFDGWKAPDSVSDATERLRLFTGPPDPDTKADTQ